jgi:hypothetical protein
MTTLFPAFRICVNVSAEHSFKIQLLDQNVTVGIELGIKQESLFCRERQAEL